jgi:AcrR family transcriptional regulator
MARGRAARYDDQREMILAQAARLFAQRGYPATSMNEVAQACGLSKATLYHYYRDKYALLVSITEGHVTRLESLVNAVAALRLPPAEELRTLVLRIVAEYAGAQDAHRVLTEDVRFLQDADRERIIGIERRVVAGFARAIAAWQPDQAAAGLATPLTMLLFGMVNWLFTWMRPERGLTHEAIAPIVADLFTGGVPAVRPPPAKAGVAPGAKAPQPT